jgi:hypothetical protein
MDGYGWANNIGGFDVAVRGTTGVPDGGSTFGLLALGLAAALFGKSRKQS